MLLKAYNKLTQVFVGVILMKGALQTPFSPFHPSTVSLLSVSTNKSTENVKLFN
jgi:hypothetical protein